MKKRLLSLITVVVLSLPLFAMAMNNECIDQVRIHNQYSAVSGKNLQLHYTRCHGEQAVYSLGTGWTKEFSGEAMIKADSKFTVSNGSNSVVLQDPIAGKTLSIGDEFDCYADEKTKQFVCIERHDK